MRSVLIVEDEIFVATDLERILQEAGFTVTAIAADRLEALAAADTAEIALVDINLRDGQTGPQIACDLSRDYGVKVIYVTANPSQIEPKADKAVGFVRKPFSDAAILAAVNYASGVEKTSPPPELTFFHAYAGWSRPDGAAPELVRMRRPETDGPVLPRITIPARGSWNSSGSARSPSIRRGAMRRTDVPSADW